MNEAHPIINFPRSESTENIDERGNPRYEIPFDDFFSFAHSVDCVIFGYADGKVKVLLIKRGAQPFKGSWAVPGDLVYPDESLNTAATRILDELTGLKDIYMDQVGSFGEVDRHPSGRVVTTAYYALVSSFKYKPHAAFWAENSGWHALDEISEMPFDHDVLISHARQKLKFMARYQPVGFELLPEKFTIGDLRELYEELLEEKYDPSNFRKKVISMGILNKLPEIEKKVSHRPGSLYQFDEKKYRELCEKGFSFRI